MLHSLKALSMQRWGWLLVLLSCLVLLCTALYFQYGLNMQPCIKCINVRAAFTAILLASLLALLAPRNTCWECLPVQSGASPKPMNCYI